MIKSTMHTVQFYKTMFFYKGKGRVQNRRMNHEIDNKDTKI